NCGKNVPAVKQLPKESPTEPEPSEEGNKPAGVLLNWHWLIKHLVEFSKNNHTRLTAPGHSLNFTWAFPSRQTRLISRK
ncbi:hypothetical protein, partial [Paractinoplanes ovalisporus]|uniref:hypothetical protein n=1 Tax=Paractinoplanes ovalisporus TaxID=2810368 RepID=UPI001F17AE82